MLVPILGLYLVGYAYYLYYFVVFKSSRKILPKPPSVEEVRIPLEKEGESLSAYEIDSSPEKPLLLYFHGNNHNITQRFYVIRLANLLHCDLLLPDYRGYGSSPGYSNRSRLEEDALAIYNYALKKKKPLLLWGESLGGYAAAYAASSQPPQKLVLFCTFSSLETIFPSLAPIFWIFPSLDSGKLLSSYKGETLIIHSAQDSLVPYSQALRNHSLIPNSSLLTISGDHTTPQFSYEDITRLASFLDLPQPKEEDFLFWLEEVKEAFP